MASSLTSTSAASAIDTAPMNHHISQKERPLVASRRPGRLATAARPEIHSRRGSLESALVVDIDSSHQEPEFAALEPHTYFRSASA
jgi:hypothetical protein